MAQKAISDADIVLVIGSSLIVAPASTMLRLMKKDVQFIIVDPNENPLFSHYVLDCGAKMYYCGSLRFRPHTFINETAENSIPKLKKLLLP
jgi:NAD-dependent SIR2 family protein deacetylase